MLRTNSLKNTNDVRESIDWTFGGVNLPYEELFKDFYNDQTHYKCQVKFGNIIKDSFQLLCFSGAKAHGWNNEMMWTHYGEMNSGFCLEFDEDILLNSIKNTFPLIQFKIENIEYTDTKSKGFLNWNQKITYEQNLENILDKISKPMTFTKSKFWEKEDERRLVFVKCTEPLFIPIQDALKTIYVGINFKNKECLSVLLRNLSDQTRLSLLVYQRNRFERWGLKEKAGGGLLTYEIDCLLNKL
jgi:hypothetical protein